MLYQDISGVPDFECEEFNSRQRDYVVLIPIINEGNRILNELKRAQAHRGRTYERGSPQNIKGSHNA